jgi:L-aminopeptidase/D-esterase-like protein
MPNDICDVPGILVGHDTDLAAGTGCTVIVCDWPGVGSVEVRGGAPGTRETDLLDPACTVAEVHAVLLTGGSAFGLEAASGVMRVLEARGVGFDAGAARVPIVPGAVLFDLGIGRADVRPDASAGGRATEAAASGAVPRGTVGAGTGATVGKLGGPSLACKGGIGTASGALPDGTIVGALVAVNALGDVVDPATGTILAGARHPRGTGWLMQGAASGADAGQMPSPEDPFGASGPATLGTNTTIGVVATTAPLTKSEARALARVAHDGLALAIRPAHTPFDGDTVFALSMARPEVRAAQPSGIGPVALGRLEALAVVVVARAVADAVTAATELHGVPGARELMWARHG